MNAVRRTKGLALVVAGTLAAAACTEETSVDITGPGQGQPRTAAPFEWRAQLAPGEELEIKGVAGAIRATPAPGAQAEVVALRSGTKSDPAEVRIEVLHHARGVTICAVYPAPAGKPANDCQPGDEGGVNTENSDAAVEFTVLVPAGVVFVGKTFVGDVDAIGLTSDAFASSVTGDVRVETAGLAEASTITGSVTAELGAADWDRDLEFTTVTGDVFVRIPAATNADVMISVLNGTVQSDFPLADAGQGRHEGTIGSGGPTLMLSTITGNITLRRE